MSGEKYYKQERARQKKFKEAEKKLDEDYKKVIQEELDAEKYSRLFPEDSTKEYNPVEFLKDGGIIKGKPRLAKRGWK